MFVRAKARLRNGKRHCYWSVVENHRNRDGRVVQRRVLCLGEISDSQRGLHELRHQAPDRDALLLKLGAAKKDAGRVYHLVDIRLPKPGEAVTVQTFIFALRRDRLR